MANAIAQDSYLRGNVAHLAPYSRRIDGRVRNQNYMIESHSDVQFSLQPIRGNLHVSNHGVSS
jgi:hypothetical protein